MARRQYIPYGDHFWYQKEDNIYTIGLQEDALDQFDEITSVEFPAENEAVDTELLLGTIETDNGQIEIFSPVNGTIVEINTVIAEDPSLIQDDPYDGWLVRIESEEEIDDEDDEEDDDLDDDEDEDDEEEEEEDDER